MSLSVIGIAILFGAIGLVGITNLAKGGFVVLVLITIVMGVYFAIALVCMTITPAAVLMLLAVPFFYILGLSIDGFKYIIKTLSSLVSKSLNSHSNFDKFFIVAVALCLTVLTGALLVILI